MALNIKRCDIKDTVWVVYIYTQPVYHDLALYELTTYWTVRL